jgi:hypothetical protein
LRHPFRLFYLLLAAVVATEIVNFVSNTFSTGPTEAPQRTWIWQVASSYPQFFYPALGLAIIVGAI